MQVRAHTLQALCCPYLILARFLLPLPRRDPHGDLTCGSSCPLSCIYRQVYRHSLISMASSSGGAFDLFGAIYGSPDLLGLVVQQCSGNKNDLRLASSRLRSAVDACVTKLAWITLNLSPFNGANGAKNMAVLARCPRLLTVNFHRRRVTDLSPLAACISLKRITRVICAGKDLTPLAALSCLEHLDCSQSIGLSDISALVACTALKHLNCNRTMIKQLPPLPCLEVLICHNTLLSDLSALTVCTALKILDCRSCDITIVPPLPASLETLRLGGTKCADLSPLAACAGLRALDCTGTPVLDLMPLLWCKRLEVLQCDNFDGINDQARQLLQARPDLDIMIGYEDDEDGEEAEDGDEEVVDDGDGYRCGIRDWDVLDFEMEGYGFGK